MDSKIKTTLKYLENRKKILFITTSNRWVGEKDSEKPKSTELAFFLKNRLKSKEIKIIDVTQLKIYPCEGNVSTKSGNTCGLKDAILKDKIKNPSGHHRCWASLNNKDDELWKISKELLKADTVIFFTSIRWGQTNSYYQKLIERLTWLENRHSTLNEENILRSINAGIIAIGQNWKGKEVIKTQKEVLKFYGFNTPNELSWNWQYSKDSSDENNESYIDAYKKFQEILNKVESQNA
jgi:multimeric flavodoxin WrbA